MVIKRRLEVYLSRLISARNHGVLAIVIWDLFTRSKVATLVRTVNSISISLCKDWYDARVSGRTAGSGADFDRDCLESRNMSERWDLFLLGCVERS